jgi:hypothetical protein
MLSFSVDRIWNIGAPTKDHTLLAGRSMSGGVDLNYAALWHNWLFFGIEAFAIESISFWEA